MSNAVIFNSMFSKHQRLHKLQHDKKHYQHLNFIVEHLLPDSVTGIEGANNFRQSAQHIAT